VEARRPPGLGRRHRRPVKVQVLDVDFSRERISLSLKATQQDPWQEFAESHRGRAARLRRVTKLVQFGAFVQVGEGIEGLVHISEMSAHHVDSPEQVVTPGEELWVKIIDLDLARRRISLSIKQAAEGGELAAGVPRALRGRRSTATGSPVRPTPRPRPHGRSTTARRGDALTRRKTPQTESVDADLTSVVIDEPVEANAE
jgi:predicted RNA-binding protein with RPS1 domain